MQEVRDTLDHRRSLQIRLGNSTCFDTARIVLAIQWLCTSKNGNVCSSSTHLYLVTLGYVVVDTCRSLFLIDFFHLRKFSIIIKNLKKNFSKLGEKKKEGKE